MASHYWIKLYQEMLRDPKVGRLSDVAYRRFIELLLLAGENEPRDGSLPCTGDIAWQLRIPLDQLNDNLFELEEGGMVGFDDNDQPFIVNFAKRQGAMSDAERMRRYRERKQLQDGYEDINETVTEPVTNRNAETETETETETTSHRGFSEAVAAYEGNIGMLTPVVSDNLNDAIKEYPAGWVVEAITVAAKSNKRSWNYIEGILRNWQRKGHPDIIPAGSNGRHPETNPGDEAWKRVLKCISVGNYKALGKDSKEGRLLMEQFDPAGILHAADKELSFIGKRFIEAYNHEYGSH